MSGPRISLAVSDAQLELANCCQLRQKVGPVGVLRTEYFRVSGMEPLRPATITQVWRGQ